MDPVDALALTGGTANLSSLRRLSSRLEIERALRGAAIVRTGWGTYALASVEAGLQLAHATAGVLCLASAALHLGWDVKSAPVRPQICYPLDRRLKPEHRRQVEARWADLATSDIVGSCTSPSKTLEMCSRTLPYDEALAIADSALRAGFEPDLRALRHARGRGAARIKRIVADADGAAANPFESAVRAIANGISGHHLRPQVWIGNKQADLVDEHLRLIVEADSFKWHGRRQALHRDANRYNGFVAGGWTVLRFSWEEVMLNPAGVAQVLERVIRRLNGEKSA